MTAATIVQEYPQFVANQVLTQDQLNKMREYLDNQNRTTRIRLIGMGIICGLQTKIVEVGSRITVIITEGYGVTSEGYIIHIPEQIYTHSQPYIDPDVNEDLGDTPNYVPFQTGFNKGTGTIPTTELERMQISIRRLLPEADPVNPSRFLVKRALQNQVLILYLELNETELKSCFTTDCNNKGQSINLEVRALLAPRTERFLPEDNCNDLTTLQPVPRFYAGLKQFINKTVPQLITSDEINGAYSHLSNYLNTALGNNAATLMKNNMTFFDLCDEEVRIEAFKSKLNSIFTRSNLNQYRYDFFKDMAHSYNELVTALCKMVTPCCNTEYFPRHLVLRDFSGPSLTRTADWRHPFYPTPVKNVMDDGFKNVKNLFLRLLDLADAFTGVPSDAELVTKITPSQSERSPLADRSIPFYYNKSSITNSWRLNACCTSEPLSFAGNKMNLPPRGAYADYLENPLHFNLNDYPLYRIEGHLGNSYGAAFSNIEKIRLEHHLDFQILTLPLKAKSFSGESSSGLDKFYLELNKSWVEINRLVSIGEGETKAYSDELDKIRMGYATLKGEQELWCSQQLAIEKDCDFSALQADYSDLRADLLCFLNKCKPMFRAGFEIEPDAGGGTGTPGIDFCSDFHLVKVGAEFGVEINNVGDFITSVRQIPVFIEEAIFEDKKFYGTAVQKTVGGNSTIQVNETNLKFGLNHIELGAVVTKISFDCSTTGKYQNLGFNSIPVAEFPILDLIDQERSEIIPNYYIQVEKISDGILRVTLDGIGFNSVTIGGSVFTIHQVCVEGAGTSGSPTVTLPTLPPNTLNARYTRIKLLCELIENMVPIDIRCFNYDVFRVAIKDMMNAALEARFIFAHLFESILGRFSPYRFYPVWQDFEKCLASIYCNCYYARFTNLQAYYSAIPPKQALTFGAFTEKYPGAIHRAGVSKGGTFIMVYNNEVDPKVVADFSLEHFVEIEDCCSCKLDPKGIKFPPVATPDYRVIKIEEEGIDIELDLYILDNDFNLQGDKSDLSIELITTNSDRGASLKIIDKTYIKYKLSGATPTVDHFTYTIKNGSGADTADVYIGILKKTVIDGGDETPTGTGQIGGEVVDARTGEPISGATIDLMNSSGATLSDTTEKEGTFDIIGPSGVYNIIVQHINYLPYGASGIEIEPDLASVLETIKLVVKGPGDDERFLTNANKVGATKTAFGDAGAFKIAETFAEKTVQDNKLSMTKISAAYKKTISPVLDAYKNAKSSKEKTAVKNTAIALLHSYMDRIVFEKPTKPSIVALRYVDKTLEEMYEIGIAIAPILKNWKVSEIKKSVAGEMVAIDKIRELFIVE